MGDPCRNFISKRPIRPCPDALGLDPHTPLGRHDAATDSSAFESLVVDPAQPLAFGDSDALMYSVDRRYGSTTLPFSPSIESKAEYMCR